MKTAGRVAAEAPGRRATPGRATSASVGSSASLCFALCGRRALRVVVAAFGRAAGAARRCWPKGSVSTPAAVRSATTGRTFGRRDVARWTPKPNCRRKGPSADRSRAFSPARRRPTAGGAPMGDRNKFYRQVKLPDSLCLTSPKVGFSAADRSLGPSGRRRRCLASPSRVSGVLSTVIRLCS